MIPNGTTGFILDSKDGEFILETAKKALKGEHK